MNETIYIKFDKSIKTSEKKLVIGELGMVYCDNPQLLAQVKAIKLATISEQASVMVFSVMRVVELICKTCDNANVTNMGEVDFIVEYESKGKKNSENSGTSIIKLIVAAAVVFVGSMYTIMAYNNDVGADELFEKIYEIFLDGVGNGSLEISYCIGLTLGIAVFYNHFVGKKLSDTPTPVEVQMRTYENDVDTAVIDRASRQGEEIDVS